MKFVLVRSLMSLALAAASMAPMWAGDAPPPPDSPLSRMVRKLAAAKAPKAPLRKEDVLLPEFRFRRAKGWLMLPELAKQLSSNEVERLAILELMNQGVTAASGFLAAEGAETDVAAATTLFMCQLWGFVHHTEVSETATDALHAQVVAALRGEEVRKMTDADKQRYWEYCLGFPVFVLGMREVVDEPSALADLELIAAAGFAAVLGVDPGLVEIGERGLQVKAGLLPDEAQVPGTTPAPPPAAPPPAATPPRAAGGLVYQPPPGWSREDADWATIFRATLMDRNRDGTPDSTSRRRHQAALFVLPPRPSPQGGGALFESIWREQFDAFALGESFVHYRSRLASGLVVHSMGRWFLRSDQPEARTHIYGVLYLVDLGDRVQPITSTVVPGTEELGYGDIHEGYALGALIPPLETFLGTIRLAAGEPPYPRGGLFSPDDIYGDWTRSSSSFGGMYVSALTGASAGMAATSASNQIRLRRDGSFVYRFGGTVTQPGMGTTFSSDVNEGSFALDGDIIRFTPKDPRSYSYDRCAVGIGRLVSPTGTKRILALVTADSEGVFRAAPMVPVGDNAVGILDWFVEEGPTKP